MMLVESATVQCKFWKRFEDFNDLYGNPICIKRVFLYIKKVKFIALIKIKPLHSWTMIN